MLVPSSFDQNVLGCCSIMFTGFMVCFVGLFHIGDWTPDFLEPSSLMFTSCIVCFMGLFQIGNWNS